MRNLTRQLVHLPLPYRCKWVDGKIVVIKLPDERVAVVENSTLFREFLGAHAQLRVENDRKRIARPVEAVQTADDIPAFLKPRTH